MILRSLFITALLLCATTALANPPSGDEAILRSTLADLAGQEMPVRLAALSRHFVGRPYILGPLGEGAAGKYDQDPERRFDGFDCTTYVETVVALARSSAYEEVPGVLRQLRYRDGILDYVERNHFPSLDWIPNNVKTGVFSDITREVGGAGVEVARALIDKPNWYAHKKLEDLHVGDAAPDQLARLLEDLRAEGRRFQPEVATLDYVPFTAMDQDFYDRLPSGLIVNIVRPNWDLVTTHENVSHQGILLRRDGVPYLRHATSAGPKQVVTVPLAEYVENARKNPLIQGLNFLRVNR